MARGRMLSKTLGVSRRFNAIADSAQALTEFTQLLYTLLVPHTDDFGRMSGDPFTIKMTVLPASPRSLADFRTAMAVLHQSQLITVYHVGDETWLQVNKFDEHQVGLHKRTASMIPAPTASQKTSQIPPVIEADSISGKFPEIPGNPDVVRKFPEMTGNSSSRARAELNLTELNRTKERRTVASPHPLPRRPVQNVKIITKIAHEVLVIHNGHDDVGADLCAEIKDLCAERHIAYDTATVRKALDSAEVQRKKARS